MLVPTQASSQTSYSNPRQVVAAAATSSAIMYTVPSGKKFQGSLWSNGAGKRVGITPSGGSQVLIELPAISTSYIATSPMPVTLVAGTIVTNIDTGATQHLIGVETDA